MQIYLLDVGTREYGDCVVVHTDEKKILIDGAHKGDSALLKKQFKAIFEQEAPYHFDLLVITHLHDDHIGCLPELVKNGDITAGKCLLMNPDFRWSAGAIDSGPTDSFVDALLEEDHSFLTDSELEEFIDASGKLVDRYKEMIGTLKANSDVMIFSGVDADNYTALENEFKSMGMKILGPTKKHLDLTRDALIGTIDTLKEFVTTNTAIDSAPNMVEKYRRAFQPGVTDSELVSDAVKNKGSINNESIVLKFKSKGPKAWPALLAGDMQFAIPEVQGLDPEMKKLRAKIDEAGPYEFIKTSHHTSYNGIDRDMLEKWIGAGTQFFGHTGGLYDSHHPDPDMLDVLKEKKEEITFVRTDRNGLIKIGKDDSGDVSMWISKGDVNTFTKNQKRRTDDGAVTVGEAGVTPKTTPAKGMELLQSTEGSHIQFAAVIPENRSVRITIEVDGEKKN